MNRDQYVDALKSKLDEWNEQIGKTEKQMMDASAEAQALLGETVRVVAAFQNVGAAHLDDPEHGIDGVFQGWWTGRLCSA